MRRVMASLVGKMIIMGCGFLHTARQTNCYYGCLHPPPAAAVAALEHLLIARHKRKDTFHVIETDESLVETVVQQS